MFIKVKVYPGSRDEAVAKVAEDKYEVRVREKPEQNLANDRARELLSGYFGVTAGSIRLVKGGRKPNKIFEIKSLQR